MNKKMKAIKCLNNRNGYALASVLIMMVVLCIIVVIFLELGVSSARMVSYQNKKKQAYYLARSGADTAAAYLISHPLDDNNMIGRSSSANTQLDIGSFTVEVAENASTHQVTVRGTGSVGAETESTALVLEKMSIGDILDKAIYSDEDLNIENMIVEGDVQSAGGIESSAGGHHTFNHTSTPNTKKNVAIDWGEAPPDTASPPDIDLTNHQEYTISGEGNYGSISVDQQAKLTLDAGSNTLKIRVDDLWINNIMAVDPNTKVEIYVDNTMIIETQGVINNQNPSNLMIYLADGALFSMQANMTLNGYVIGPNATVEMQSDHSTVNGAIFAHKLQRNGSGNPHGVVNYVPLNTPNIYLDELRGYFAVRWQD